MKRSVAFFVCVAALLAFAATSLAQSNPSGSQTTGRKVGVVAKKRMRGTVVGIDAGARTLAISYRNANVTFDIDAATKIKVNGNAGALEDIQKGENVTVVYKHQGKKKVAVTIIAQTGVESQGRR